MSDEPTTAAPPEPPPASDPPPPPAPESGSGGSGSENRTVMLVLSYLWILALIPFLFEKDDEEVKWHSKHGLVLTAAEIALWIVISIMNWILGAVLGPLACLGCVFFLVVWVGILVFRIMAINLERVPYLTAHFIQIDITKTEAHVLYQDMIAVSFNLEIVVSNCNSWRRCSLSSYSSVITKNIIRQKFER